MVAYSDRGPKSENPKLITCLLECFLKKDAKSSGRFTQAPWAKESPITRYSISF